MIFVPYPLHILLRTLFIFYQRQWSRKSVVKQGRIQRMVQTIVSLYFFLEIFQTNRAQTKGNILHVWLSLRPLLKTSFNFMFLELCNFASRQFNQFFICGGKYNYTATRSIKTIVMNTYLTVLSQVKWPMCVIKSTIKLSRNLHIR